MGFERSPRCCQISEEGGVAFLEDGELWRGRCADGPWMKGGSRMSRGWGWGWCWCWLGVDNSRWHGGRRNLVGL